MNHLPPDLEAYRVIARRALTQKTQVTHCLRLESTVCEADEQSGGMSTANERCKGGENQMADEERYGTDDGKDKATQG